MLHNSLLTNSCTVFLPSQEEFFRHKDVTDEEEIAHLVHRGRWYLKNEVIGAIQLRKYRTLRKRYGSDVQAPQIDKGPAPPPLRPPLDEASKN